MDTDDSDADELIVVYPTSVVKATIDNDGSAATTSLPSLSKNFVHNNNNNSKRTYKKTTNDAIIEIDDDDDAEEDFHRAATSTHCVASTRAAPQHASSYARAMSLTECLSSDDESLISKPKSKRPSVAQHDTFILHDDTKFPTRTSQLDPTSSTAFVNLENEDDDDDNNDLISFNRFDMKKCRFEPADVVIRSSSPTRNWPTSQLSSSSGDDNSFICSNRSMHATTKFPTNMKNDHTHARTQSDDDDNDSDDDSLDAIKNRLHTTKPAAISKTQNTECRLVQAVPSKKSNMKQSRVCADKTNQAQAKLMEREKRNEDRIRIRKDKEAEKCAKKEQRERQRIEKQLADEAEKVAKKRYREECKQTSGKLAKEEIAVLLQKELFNSYTVIPDLEQMGYHVQDHPSALQCNAIQWIRKDALKGGAELAVQHLHSAQSEYQHFPIVTILIDDAEAFVKLLARSPDDEEEDDYPALEDWLMGIEYGWRASWKIPSTTETNVTVSQQPTRPRLILLLVKITEALDKMWIQYRKQLSTNDPTGANRRSMSSTNANMHPPPTAEELHDAITWILIQFQIECVHCKSNEDVSVQLCKVTRLLAESPYRKPVTEFSCIKKIKATHNLDENDESNSFERAKDCWMRQLQQIPNISQPRALHFTKFYPTPLSLWIAYQNPSLSLAQKRSLVANCFHETVSHLKLSEKLYTVMTSQDPNEMIH